ncbi:hypothetical protein K2Y11_19165 [bacterium]|nr:hypothetical protein [bacterium]
MLIWMITMAISAPQVVEPDQINRRLSGQVIQVKDVVTSVLGTGDARQFRLKRAGNVIFRVGERGPAELRGNVAVTGTVQADGSQIIVDVQSVNLLPSDVDQFESRAKKIKEGDFAAWYELADWARQRFRLYNDSKMKENSLAAYAKGLKVERQAATGDIEKIRSLRRRLQDQDYLPTPDFADIDHELLWVQLEEKNPKSPPEINSFADEIAKILRGNAALPTTLSHQQREAYDRDPIRTYTNQKEADRPSFARFWEMKLRRRAIEEQVQSGELNAYQAADEAARLISDYPEVEKGWLEKAVQKDEQQLIRLRRRDVEWMTDHLKDRLKEPGRSDKIRRTWLTMMEDRIRKKESENADESKRAGRSNYPQDARARYDLAMIILEWYPDDKELDSHAAELLIEAVKIEPNYEQAGDVLRRLGYFRESSGNWLTPEQAANVKIGENQPRTVDIGMDEEMVQKILGNPDVRARVVTGPRQEQMQWAYRSLDRAVYVQFERNRDSQWRVSSIHGGSARQASEPTP